MTMALNFVFDIIVAILVYEYLKRDKKWKRMHQQL